MFNNKSTHTEGNQLDVKQGGVNNTTHIDQSINLYINTPLSPLNVDKIVQDLTSANVDNSYLVFICAPNDETSTEKAKEIFLTLTEKLTESDIKYIIGGGKSFLEMIGPYHHINEADFLSESKCNALIVIADDHSTFSQLSLLSKIKFDKDDSSIELFAFCNKATIEDQEFYKNGPISFFIERAKGTLISFDEYDKEAITSTISSIARHKLFWTSRKKKHG